MEKKVVLIFCGKCKKVKKYGDFIIPPEFIRMALKMGLTEIKFLSDTCPECRKEENSAWLKKHIHSHRANGKEVKDYENEMD